MSGFSQFELQKAIYQTLAADTHLMTTIAGVYDRVPEGSMFPYITIGEASCRDWSSKTSTGVQIVVTLHVFSRTGGHKQTVEIMERIHTLLHEGSMSLDGHVLVMMRFEFSNVLTQNDGMTYQGVIRLRALTEAA